MSETAEMISLHTEIEQLRSIVNGMAAKGGDGSARRLEDVERRLEGISKRLDDISLEQHQAKQTESRITSAVRKHASNEVARIFEKDFLQAVEPLLDAQVDHEKQVERTINSKLMTVETDTAAALKLGKQFAEASAEALIDLAKHYSKGVAYRG